MKRELASLDLKSYLTGIEISGHNSNVARVGNLKSYLTGIEITMQPNGLYCVLFLKSYLTGIEIKEMMQQHEHEQNLKIVPYRN